MAEFNYEIVRHLGRWRVLHLGRHSQPHADQDAAIRAARKTARKQAKAGRDVEIRLNRTDGGVVVLPLDGDETAAPEQALIDSAAAIAEPAGEA